MKGFLYIASLLLSAPNLIAGTASLLLKHTFATRNPLQIVTDFLFQVVWGLPLAAVLFLVLLVLGIVARTRAYAALFAFVLNITALGFVLHVFGLPHDFGEAVFFLPLLLALIGFAWAGYGVFCACRDEREADYVRRRLLRSLRRPTARQGSVEAP
jgi:hypothetical protein